MLTVNAVFSTDRINRYGERMEVAVLEKLLSQRWDVSLPTAVSHDIHRATGYNIVTALLVQPGLARIVGTICVAETAEEKAVVRTVLNNTLARRLNEIEPARFDELRMRIGSALSAEAELMTQDCVSFCDPQVARRRFPELFDSGDKDGLIALKDLNPIAPGVFEKERLLLFAHRFFRRALSHFNSLNDPFLGRFLSMREQKGLDLRIALDEDMLGLPGTLRKTMELEYWWGPHFSNKLNTNPSPAVTRHKANEEQAFFSAIASTDFWWYSQNENRSFEVEELRDLDIPSAGESKEHFGSRFVHSLVDPKTGIPFHLDGAIRMYNEDLMLKRVDHNLATFGKQTEYTKIWRIDGKLAVQDWKSLINDYYRDNHLVGEYFGASEAEEGGSVASMVQTNDSSIYHFVPGTMNPGEGIRIAISYHPHGSLLGERHIVAKDTISRVEDKFDYVEACSSELRKLIERRGASIAWPAGLIAVAFEDKIDNFPLVSHDCPDAVRDAEVTLDAIREYCVALGDDNRVISFHLSIRFADRNLLLSFLGHVADMVKWLASGESALPASLGEIGQWAGNAAKRLTALFPDAPVGASPELTLMSTGIQIAGRKCLLPGEFDLKTEEGSEVPTVIIIEAGSTAEAVELLLRRQIVPTFGMIIKASECSGCGGDYATCGCVKVIDAEVGQYIKDFEPAGVYWTNRPAWNVRVKLRRRKVSNP